jgi:hypothetical protein
MEPCSSTTWTSRDRQDIAMSSPCSKIIYTIISSVGPIYALSVYFTDFTSLATNRYSQSRLLEINSHSLFSRWFSESGKLVQRLFSNIMEMVEDEDCFVVVLIGKSSIRIDRCVIRL